MPLPCQLVVGTFQFALRRGMIPFIGVDALFELLYASFVKCGMACCVKVRECARCELFPQCARDGAALLVQRLVMRRKFGDARFDGIAFLELLLDLLRTPLLALCFGKAPLGPLAFLFHALRCNALRSFGGLLQRLSGRCALRLHRHAILLGPVQFVLERTTLFPAAFELPVFIT